jgi:GNAT superfamily N-acetyltransferase
MNGYVHSAAITYCDDNPATVPVRWFIELNRYGTLYLHTRGGVIDGILVRDGWYFYRIAADDVECAAKLMNKIPNDRAVGFAGLPMTFRHIAVERFGKPEWESKSVTYVLPNSVEVPEPSVEIKPLREVDCLQVAMYWPHGSDLEYMRHLVDTQPSFAVYEGGFPVSYAMLHSDGAMGFLHTMDHARGRGFAKQISFALIRWLRENGRTPFCYVIETNTPSRTLCESLGMVVVDECTWIGFNPNIRRTENG